MRPQPLLSSKQTSLPRLGPGRRRPPRLLQWMGVHDLVRALPVVPQRHPPPRHRFIVDKLDRLASDLPRFRYRQRVWPRAGRGLPSAGCNRGQHLEDPGNHDGVCVEHILAVAVDTGVVQGVGGRAGLLSYGRERAHVFL